MKTKPNREMLSLMHKDPENWRFIFFYFNRKDSRLIVPKRYPYLGWTLNFANMWAYLFLASIIIFAIVCQLIRTA
jgi:uncharacterized membrane protein